MRISTGTHDEGEAEKLATPSWDHLLRGLWESALRLEELMHVSWDIPGFPSAQPRPPAAPYAPVALVVGEQEDDVQ